jgi:2-polyprenyl-3-methyl-5-hydroxy-6-metoxy-1,4-benzoquinol methylase
VQTITSIAELDQKLDLAAKAAKRSGDDFRRVLESFVLDPRGLVGPVDPDPRSSRYRDQQMKLYELVAERHYQTENESTPFDREQMLRWPFPYSTRSASLVGDYLMTYGNLIKSMNLAQGARVLEIGSGYGPLTWHLASMGIHVTCVDVHEPLLEYISERTRGLPGKVETLAADMNALDIKGSFDAIVFFESFHHAADHAAVLRALPQLLEPNGFLVLGGEPIVPTGSLAVPYPWGLRMDGLSLWYIRRHGWMELGFEEGYFRSLLEGMGWSVSFKPNRALPLMDVWMARRLEGDSAYSKPSNNDVLAIWEAKDRKLCTQVGKLAADSRAIESTGAPGYLVYGPYVQLEGGFYEVQWHGRTGATLATGQADVACDGGQTILSVADFSISANAVAKPNQVIAHARFSVTHAITDVEFRMRIDAGAHLGIERVILRKL